MSSPGSPDGNTNPFQNIFGDIVRLIGSNQSGPINWDVARQIAALIAGEGQIESNVDPLERIRLEELARVAELHVNQQTELGISIRSVTAVNHVDWALNTLEAYHPLLEGLATSLSQPPADADETNLPAAEQQGLNLERIMSPMLIGMQAGGMVGYLSRRALGQYDLPIPRNTHDTLVFIPENINTYSSEWSLPKDELSLYVAVEEVTRLAIISRPHVYERFTTLLSDYVNGFETNSQGMQERLEMLNIADPNGLPSALNDPQSLLGVIQTPAQKIVLLQLNALASAYVGYVDHVVKSVAAKIIPSASAIAEANKRRRVEESDGGRLVEGLFGLELNQTQFDRGEAFINGVLERQGETGLARLWRSANELPTPAEVDAPGLWLERIDLPS